MFLVLLCLSAVASTFASELSVSYYQATLQDVPKLLSLSHTIGKDNEEDLQKVVKLPDRFLEKSLQQDVKNKKIFIAFDHSNYRIVGYKKLFKISNPEELKDIMCNEVRCTGDKSFLVDYAIINSTDTSFNRVPTNDHIPFIQDDLDLCLYTGADYVTPALRNQGIGKELYMYSLSNVFNIIIKSNINNYNRLVFLYGLSRYNDFEIQGEGKSRTSSIVCSVVSALNKINIPFDNRIQHYRFQACMPAFIDNGKDCVLLPDEQGIFGFGNVVIFTLKKD